MVAVPRPPATPTPTNILIHWSVFVKMYLSRPQGEETKWLSLSIKQRGGTLGKKRRDAEEGSSGQGTSEDKGHSWVTVLVVSSECAIKQHFQENSRWRSVWCPIF